jgi:hypothetical protein
LAIRIIRSVKMIKGVCLFAILALIGLTVLSCSTSYNWDDEKAVANWLQEQQKHVKVNVAPPREYRYLKGTRLNLTDNTDIAPESVSPHEDFVTKYCSICKINVGPGHIHGLTRWCEICKAEVSSLETVTKEGTPHWHDPLRKDVHTHWCYVCYREAFEGHRHDTRDKETAFCYVCKREAGPDHVHNETIWCPICWQEAGKGHEHMFTKYCPTSPCCLQEVSRFGMKKLIPTAGLQKDPNNPEKIPNKFVIGYKDPVPYGHVCGETNYSYTWSIDIPLVGPRSKIDYLLLDTVSQVESDIHYRPNKQPRIAMANPEEFREFFRDMPKETALPWVEERSVFLDPDIFAHLAWKWKNPELSKLVMELAPRKVKDVAKEAWDYFENMSNPEFKWRKQERETPK